MFYAQQRADPEPPGEVIPVIWRRIVIFGFSNWVKTMFATCYNIDGIGFHNIDKFKRNN